MATLTRKVLRTIKLHKVKYILTILLVFLGCLLYTAFNISVSNVKKELLQFRTHHFQEDFNFKVQNPLSDINYLENKYNVSIEERQVLNYDYNKNTTLRILSATEKIDTYAVTKGESLKQSNDILINSAFADDHKIKIGDNIDIFSNGFKVVGFFSSPDYVYMLKTDSDMVVNNEAFGVAVISKEDMMKMKKGYTYYVARFNGAENNSDKLKENINKDNLIVDWRNADDTPRITTINGDINTYIQIGAIVPTFILIITCSLVSVFLWRLLRDEYVQLGTIYALGYKKRTLIFHYLCYPLFVCTIGSILGTFCGIFFSNQIVKGVFGYKYNLPAFSGSIDISQLIISLLLPFIILIPVTLIIINKALKKSPLDLMKNGNSKIKVGLLEKKASLSIYNFNLRFMIKEMLRNLRRGSIIYISVIFASIMLLLGFAVNDSINYMFNSMVGNFVNNYNYTFNSMQLGTPQKGEGVSVSKFEVQTKQGEKIALTVFGIKQDAELVRFKDINGNRISLSNTIISSGVAKILGVKEGDTIKAKNKSTSKTIDIKIDKFAEDYNYYIYMPMETFNKLNGYPVKSYMSILSNEKLSIDNDLLMSVLNSKDQKEGYHQLTKTVKALIGIMGVISFIIGLIVIFIITNISIDENKSGISLMKVLGYSEKNIISIMLNYNIIYVILGFITAIPLIFKLMEGFFEIVGKQMNAVIPVRLNLINIIICFITIILTYEISKYISSRNVLKICMSDSLKSQRE